MNIRLTPHSEELINEQLARGVFRSPEEVIEHALEVLQDEDVWLRDNKDLINDKIERGFEQFERGEFFPAAEARADMEKRKAAWLTDHERG